MKIYDTSKQLVGFLLIAFGVLVVSGFVLKNPENPIVKKSKNLATHTVKEGFGAVEKIVGASKKVPVKKSNWAKFEDLVKVVWDGFLKTINATITIGKLVVVIVVVGAVAFGVYYLKK